MIYHPGFQGMADIPVIPLSGVTAKNATIFSGDATESMLQYALNNAQGPAQ